MQFSSLLNIIAVVAIASYGLSECVYQVGNATCVSGTKNYSFDANATRENEQVCEGRNLNVECMQTACCS
ncbi:hypothetical protein BUE80_DR008179 [Diplocarpon rosae]|nr:hypothetical protein BUE80_DR008179 [Diplocarpon rosae]